MCSWPMGEPGRRCWPKSLHALAGEVGLVGTHGYSSHRRGRRGHAAAHHDQPSASACHNRFFLLPGYGAQGATADMTRAAFQNGHGAIVSASRSILYAHRESQIFCRSSASDWEQCVEARHAGYEAM